MYVTWQLIISVCAGFSAICLSAGYLIKIYKGLKKPGEDMKSSISGNKTMITQHEDKFKGIDEKLKHLDNATNLIIRSLFTVLGELSANNDVNGHIAKAQSEIQEFLTPVK
jgi:hypothetical protein